MLGWKKRRPCRLSRGKSELSVIQDNTDTWSSEYACYRKDSCRLKGGPLAGPESHHSPSFLQFKCTNSCSIPSVILGHSYQTPRMHGADHIQDTKDFQQSTDFGKPLGHSAIDLIQDEDDHKVDDDCCCSHCHPDIGACGLVERQSSRSCDPIYDDPKDNGECQGDLFREDRRRKAITKQEIVSAVNYGAPMVCSHQLLASCGYGLSNRGPTKPLRSDAAFWVFFKAEQLQLLSDPNSLNHTTQIKTRNLDTVEYKAHPVISFTLPTMAIRGAPAAP